VPVSVVLPNVRLQRSWIERAQPLLRESFRDHLWRVHGRRLRRCYAHTRAPMPC
jgi:hypothetical protein